VSLEIPDRQHWQAALGYHIDKANVERVHGKPVGLWQGTPVKMSLEDWRKSPVINHSFDSNTPKAVESPKSPL
jgi:hypothetical protein